MNEQELKSIVKTISKCLPKKITGAGLADIYVLLGIELNMSHLLRPEALPPENLEPPLPSVAPELYRERAEKRERPCPFIERVYGKWLGKGLARSHLLHLDRPLYDALHTWLWKNGTPEGFDLPSKKQINDQELAELGIQKGEALPYPSYSKGLKDKLRLYNAARNRGEE